MCVATLKIRVSTPVHGSLPYVSCWRHAVHLVRNQSGTVIALFSNRPAGRKLTAFFINPPFVSLSGALNLSKRCPDGCKPFTILKSHSPFRDHRAWRDAKREVGSSRCGPNFPWRCRFLLSSWFRFSVRRFSQATQLEKKSETMSNNKLAKLLTDKLPPSSPTLVQPMARHCADCEPWQ